jgi:pSer/pThr/pTyr-binding forkhead associated (FHA) protein
VAPASPDSAVSLYLVDSGQIIPLEDRDSFTIGRSAPGQPILPDIDLAPYHAYENGVSRLHASIQITDLQILITDLGSVNGSRVNGQKIFAHKPFALNHGDIMTLGKLKLQVLVHRT